MKRDRGKGGKDRGRARKRKTCGEESRIHRKKIRDGRGMKDERERGGQGRGANESELEGKNRWKQERGS